MKEVLQNRGREGHSEPSFHLCSCLLAENQTQSSTPHVLIQKHSLQITSVLCLYVIIRHTNVRTVLKFKIALWRIIFHFRKNFNSFEYIYSQISSWWYFWKPSGGCVCLAVFNFNVIGQVSLRDTTCALNIYLFNCWAHFCRKKSLHFQGALGAHASNVFVLYFC